MKVGNANVAGIHKGKRNHGNMNIVAVPVVHGMVVIGKEQVVQCMVHWHMGFKQELVGDKHGAPGETIVYSVVEELEPLLEPGVFVENLSFFEVQTGVRFWFGHFDEGLVEVAGVVHL